MEALLRRIQYKDDQQAFKQLYRQLFFRLYQFAYSFISNKESAEEVVNDVFLRLWQKRHALNTIENMNVYLYVSVKNASFNFLRKNSLTPVSLEELSTDHIQLSVSPESWFITQELQHQIRAAIEQLPPRCKLIFKLIKDDGLSYKEAAAILEISVKTVDAQLCRALKKLEQLLLPVWKEYKNEQVKSQKN